MAEQNQQTSSPIKPWLWRITGFGIAGIYIIYGTVIVLGMLIIGLWEGFARPVYIAQFLLMTLYVYSTAALAVLTGLKQSKKLLAVLLILLLPLFWIMVTSIGTENESRKLASIYAANENAQETVMAKQALLEKGRLAGRHPAVDTLMKALETARTDTQKIHLIKVLGEISYQYKPLLATLHDIRQETREDPQRQALFKAASEALYNVNPYQQTTPEDNE